VLTHAEPSPRGHHVHAERRRGALTSSFVISRGVFRCNALAFGLGDRRSDDDARERTLKTRA
jgi:hypothetical protein